MRNYFSYSIYTVEERNYKSEDFLATKEEAIAALLDHARNRLSPGEVVESAFIYFGCVEKGDCIHNLSTSYTIRGDDMFIIRGCENGECMIKEVDVETGKYIPFW